MITRAARLAGTVARPVLLAWCLAPAVLHAEVDRATLVGLSASVLKVEVQRIQGGYSLGSGVVVDTAKVVTNCHVTRDARDIHVLRGDVRWHVEAQAAQVDHDLCVLRVPDLKAEVVSFGRAATLTLGQPVTAVGFTGGLGIQNSPGDVVALHRHGGGRVIQSSNWFSSGASGGGLFDDDLRLVGILTFRQRGGAAHYYTAPVEWVQQLLAAAQPYRKVAPIAAAELAYWQQPDERQPNFLQAATLERNRNWRALASLASGWRDSDAGDAEPWYLLGVSLAQLDRLDDARQAIEHSLTLEPASGSTWLALGLLYLRQGLIDRAREVLARLEALKSDLASDLGKAIAKI